MNRTLPRQCQSNRDMLRLDSTSTSLGWRPFWARRFGWPVPRVEMRNVFGRYPPSLKWTKDDDNEDSDDAQQHIAVP